MTPSSPPTFVYRWYCLYQNHLGIYNGNFTLKKNQKVMNIWQIFFLFFDTIQSIYHAKVFVPRQNCLNIYMVQSGFDPNTKLGIQRFSHLDVLRNHQHL